MTITASGGSFRDYALEDLKNVSIKEREHHYKNVWNLKEFHCI